MRIIQSFWSRPFFNPLGLSPYSRLSGGFPLKRHFIYTLALSVLTIKSKFKKLELVTDDGGYELLIDYFKFPYDSASTELNCIENISPGFWAAGKTYTYSMINEPFIHFDNDIILGNKFDKESLDNSNLTVELEFSDRKLGYYKENIEEVKRSPQLYLSDIHRKQLNKNHFYYRDYNLGIVGGNDYKLLNQFGEKAFYLFAKNSSLSFKNSEIFNSFLNVYFEQFYFFHYLKYLSIVPSKLLQGVFSEDYPYQKSDIERCTLDFNFLHFHFYYKQFFYSYPEKLLERFYPDNYFFINEKLEALIKSNPI